MTSMAKVLLVEDNELNRKLMLSVLEKYQVVVAEDGEKGVLLAEEEMPDLILMDIRLPGIDGITAADLIRKNPKTRSIPIVALTASAMKGDEERILSSGFADYVAKPVKLHDFLKKIERLLKEIDT